MADLSRFMTLERGDVILTGTPAGTGIVAPGDVVAVELEGAGSVTSSIVEASAPLPAYGAMPKATAEARAFAAGGPMGDPRPARLSAEAQAALRRVSTATLTAQLTRRGIETTFLPACGRHGRVCEWSDTPGRSATGRCDPMCARPCAASRTPRSEWSRASPRATC